MPISLVRPKLEELPFRQSLLADEETMQYNHAYGGTIPFPRERWEDWYQRWIAGASADYFYRYLCDTEQNEYVGEAAYHRDRKRDLYLCDVVVLARFRGRGYGGEGLSALCRAARENGVCRLYDEIARDNPALSLFLKSGFQVECETEEYTRVFLKLHQ